MDEWFDDNTDNILKLNIITIFMNNWLIINCLLKEKQFRSFPGT